MNDRYLIQGILGEGGMGQVYRAKQRDTGRVVALKVLHPSLCTDPSTRKRFEFEAEIARRLVHANSIRVFDFGEKDGLLYLAMELIEGKTLTETLGEQGRFEWRRGIRIGAQICGSLQDAHDHNVIHRDLKSDNVMLLDKEKEDVVKVLDFGIAKILETDGEDQRTRLTQTGMVLGTPQYMSPEQIRGEDLDHRSDIYSLGVILYEMIAGRLPFESQSPMGMLTMHLHDPVEPFSVRDPALTVPRKLEQAVLRALSKERDKRPDSMTAFASELEEVLLDDKMAMRDDTLPVPSPTKSRRSLFATLSVVFLVVGLALLGFTLVPLVGSDNGKTKTDSIFTQKPNTRLVPGGPEGVEQPISQADTSIFQRPELSPPVSSACAITVRGGSVSFQIAALLQSRYDFIQSCAVYEKLNLPVTIFFTVPARSTGLTNLNASVPISTHCLTSVLLSENLKNAPKKKQEGSIRFDFGVFERTMTRCRIQIVTKEAISTGSKPPGNTPGEDQNPEDDVEGIPIQDLLPDPESIKDNLEWIKDKFKKPSSSD